MTYSNMAGSYGQIICYPIPKQKVIDQRTKNAHSEQRWTLIVLEIVEAIQ